MQHKKNPEAISSLRDSLNLNPENANALHLMALCLYQRGKIDEASKYFKASLKSDPENTKARNDYVTLLYEKKDYLESYKQAVISVNDLTYTQPETSLFLKSQAASKLGQRSKKFKKIAENSLNSTLKYNSKHCGALYHLAELYNQDKKFKKSYVYFHKSLKNCQLPQDKMKALSSLIPLSKKFGLVYQWGRYKQLQAKLMKNSKIAN